MRWTILLLNIFSYLAFFGRKLQLFIFNNVFLIKRKSVRFSKKHICRFFSDEQFYFLTFFRISHSLTGKWIFWFCKKPFLMDRTRTVGQKWLAKELDLHFLTLKKCTKGQSNRSILSKVIVLTNYKSNRQTDRQTQTDMQSHRQTNTFAKTIFSGSYHEGWTSFAYYFSLTSNFYKNGWFCQHIFYF